MDSPDADVFSYHSDLITRGADLIEDRALQIEASRRSSSDPDITDVRNNIIAIFKSKSLKKYAETLRFLAGEILSEDPVRYSYLLPHGRTLMDIHARFLHLVINCRDENRQALCCIAMQLSACARIKDSSSYIETLAIYQDFLDSTNTTFPTNASEVSWYWFKDKGYGFASANSMLTSENIRRYSVYSKETFDTKNTYDIYSHVSEVLHGNPFYYNEPHNERFWIMAIAEWTTAFLIELVDRQTLLRVLPADYRAWLKELKESKSEFIRVWKASPHSQY